MTLEDLKYGMYVELRNDSEGIIILPPYTSHCIKVETNRNTYFDYNKDLTHLTYKEADIMKVLDNDKNVIWRRENFKYPIYKKGKVTGTIIKFDTLYSGTVIFKGRGKGEIGRHIKGWMPHTDNKHWEDIIYDEERGLFDKQLVWCWEEGCRFFRGLKFYDAKYKCTFNYNTGTRNGSSYYNYEPFKDEWPEWAKEDYKKLKD